MTNSGLAAVNTAADHESVHWEWVAAVVLLCWLVIALVVAAVVGHGIAFGMGNDPDSG
jgi:hypothetical protein